MDKSRIIAELYRLYRLREEGKKNVGGQITKLDQVLQEIVDAEIDRRLNRRLEVRKRRIR